ncbi:MAG: hypothetical protein ACYC2H_00980 [Thermoplasmatota archaeon]
MRQADGSQHEMANGPPEKAKRAEWVEEWKSINIDLRHFGQKRFLILSVTIALNGYLLKALTDTWTTHGDSYGAFFLLAIAGFAGTGVLWGIEYGNHRYVRSMLDHGRALERKLGTISVLSIGLPKRKRGAFLVTSTWWSGALYALMTGGWLLFAVIFGVQIVAQAQDAGSNPMLSLLWR